MLILVGMPGSGKSTLGKVLAHSLKLPFVDTDHVIEKKIGCSIKEFFSTHGEAAFRDIEQKVIAEVCHQKPCVLATGGGAVLRHENHTMLRSAGFIVYLRIQPEHLLKRLQNDVNRPLLQVEDMLMHLRDMFKHRESKYAACAHFTVDASRSSASLLVNTIKMQIELGNHDRWVRLGRAPNPPKKTVATNLIETSESNQPDIPDISATTEGYNVLKQVSESITQPSKTLTLRRVRA